MIGVSSLCLLDSPLEQVLKVFDAGAFSYVEIICEGNHTNLEALKSYDFAVSFHAPFSDLNIASLNKAILKESLNQISDCIGKACKYDVEAVCVHPGHFSPLGMYFREKALATQIRSLRLLAKKAEECSILLGVENMPYFSILCARTAEEVERILNEVDSPYLGFTFDVGHANITGNVEQFLSLKEYITTVHLHDNAGDQDTHLALGEGTLPLDIIEKVAGKKLVIEVNTYQDVLRSLDVLKTVLP